MAALPPEALSAVIDAYDQRTTAFDLAKLSSTLGIARAELGEVSEDLSQSAFDDVLAFALAPGVEGYSPWNSHFGPQTTLVSQQGGNVYLPDVAAATEGTLTRWRERLALVKHPQLRARYGDLLWDLGPVIAPNTKRDGKSALMALDAYLATTALPDIALDEAFRAAARALNLAVALKNLAKRDAARETILGLDQRAKAKGSAWSDAYDLLLAQPKSGLTDEERDSLVAGLEAGLARYSQADIPARFDPPGVQAVAARLLAHYRRTRQPDEERRVHAVVARATEHFAALADALLASSLLAETVESYRSAGLDEEAERIRRLMKGKVREANAKMTAVRTEYRVSFDEVDAFKATIVDEDKFKTLMNIAAQFLLKRKALEAAVASDKRTNPLASAIPHAIMGEDYQVASVGSAEDDPFGHLLRRAMWAIQEQTTWLGWAFEAAGARHRYDTGDLVAWCNRAGLFSDGMLLSAGIDAWREGDDLKAVHILIPQVERALRALVESVGRPGTKGHPRFKGSQSAITMGDIIYNKDTVMALGSSGPDLALHVATLYADSRGMNLRNDLAHGLLDWREIHPGLTQWIIHTLLVLGFWRAQAPAPAVSETADGEEADADEG